MTLLLWIGSEGNVLAASTVTIQRDGSLQIAGRNLKCANARNVLDARLPNLGISVPSTRLLVMNPLLIARQPEVVRLFVFHHECGHHHVGANELAADCWAVRRGVLDGWLTKPAIAQVCKSFGNGPATPTHPAGAQRCAHVERCLAAAETEAARASAAPPGRNNVAPRLVSAPRVIREGVSRQ